MIPTPINRLIQGSSFLFCFLLLPIKITFAQTESYSYAPVPFSHEFSSFLGWCILQDQDGFMWFGSSPRAHRLRRSCRRRPRQPAMHQVRQQVRLRQAIIPKTTNRKTTNPNTCKTAPSVNSPPAAHRGAGAYSVSLRVSSA